MNRGNLHLLDSILILVILLYLNFTTAALAPTEILLTVATITAGAWVAWRKSEHWVAAAIFSGCAFAVFGTANSPISIIALWCAVVALRISMGKTAAYVYAGLIVAASFSAQLFIHASVGKIALETVAGAVAAAVGLDLAATITRQRFYEEHLRDTALAKERERIAATLHDGLGHRLTTIGMSLDFAMRVKDQERAAAEIRRARADVSSALDEMRVTVRAMKPVALPDEDIDDIDAVLAHLAKSFATTSLDVRFKREGGASYSLEERMLMLRFCQEALTNVLRHAQASRVDITLDGRVVSVADNGVGNDAAESFGITSLRERASLLGGSIQAIPHGGVNGGFRLTLQLKEKR